MVQENIMRTSETWVIMNNMLMRMDDSRLIWDDIVEGNINIVTQFYGEEQAAEAADQYEGNNIVSDSDGESSDGNDPVCAY